MKLFILLLGAAVVALVSLAVVDTDSSSNRSVTNEFEPVTVDDSDHVFTDDDEKGKKNDNIGEYDIDEDSVIDGVPVKYLTTDEIANLLKEEDKLLESELNIIVDRKLAKLRKNGQSAAEGAVVGTRRGRQKRFIQFFVSLLVAAARNLFKGSKVVKTTTSGARVTRQYEKAGNYQDALNDFNSLNPDNLKTFDGKISGQTGTVGNHRVTVRDGSSSGEPTLEIRSPKPDEGEFVRKFRYDDPE